MIFERAIICSKHNPYSIYFRVAAKLISMCPCWRRHPMSSMALKLAHIAEQTCSQANIMSKLYMKKCLEAALKEGDTSLTCRPKLLLMTCGIVLEVYDIITIFGKRYCKSGNGSCWGSCNTSDNMNMSRWLSWARFQELWPGLCVSCP